MIKWLKQLVAESEPNSGSIPEPDEPKPDPRVETWTTELPVYRATMTYHNGDVDEFLCSDINETDTGYELESIDDVRILNKNYVDYVGSREEFVSFDVLSRQPEVEEYGRVIVEYTFTYEYEWRKSRTSDRWRWTEKRPERRIDSVTHDVDKSDDN